MTDRAWERVKDVLLYALLAVAIYIYVQHERGKAVEAIRGELNDLGRTLCENSQKQDAVGHYNAALDALIRDSVKRRGENQQRGDTPKASINSELIGALRTAKLDDTPADCSKPLLPPR